MKTSDKLSNSVKELWKISKEEMRLTKQVTKLSRTLLKSVNKHLKNLGCEHQFRTDGLSENYLGEKDILIHAVFPTYPTKYSLMGLFLIRITDIQHPSYEKYREYSARYVINMNKINTPKKIAKAIHCLLESPVKTSREFASWDGIVSEDKAKEFYKSHELIRI